MFSQFMASILFLELKYGKLFSLCRIDVLVYPSQTLVPIKPLAFYKSYRQQSPFSFEKSSQKTQHEVKSLRTIAYEKFS